MANPRDVYLGLKERGFAPHLAAGIMGNMAVESGFDTGINEINPVVKGSRGGFGLNQWTGPRRRGFEAFAAERGADLADLDTQLDFMAFELNGKERKAGKLLSQAKTAEQAAAIYSNRFLRPGIPHLKKRLEHTRGLFDAINSFEESGTQVADSGQIANDATQQPTATPAQPTQEQIQAELQRRGEPAVNQATPDRAAIIAELQRRGEDVSQYQTSTSQSGQPDRAAIIAELQRRGEDVSQYDIGPQPLAEGQNPDGTFGQIPEGMVFDEATGGFADTKVIAQRTRDNSPLMGPASKFIQGAPFVGESFDEAIGATMGPVQQGVTREIQAGFEEDNPKTALGLRVAGGVTGAIPIAAAAGPSAIAAAPTSLAGQTIAASGAGVVAGATEGAVSGFGRGNDGDRIKTATNDAAIGLAAGAAFGALGPSIKAGARHAARWFKGSDVKVIAKELGIDAGAAKVIRNAMLNDDLDAAMLALSRSGDDAMLSDAGRATKELLDATVESGGAAGRIGREAIEERASIAGAKMKSTLDRYLGQAQSVKAMQGDVRKGSQAARQVTYDAAYSKPIDYAKGGRSLEPLLKRIPDDVINKANRLMKLEGAESQQILATIGDKGEVVFETLPDVRQLDYITRALNDASKGGQDAGALGGRTQASNALSDLSTAIRARMRKLVPEYGKALDTASDAITETNAIDAGYKLLRKAAKRGDAVEALKGASKAERAAMKRGIRSYIDDTMANVSQVISDPNIDAREGLKLVRELSSRANQDKLNIVLGKKASAALGKELDAAATSLELRSAIAQNSKTAIRGSIKDSVNEISSGGAIRELASGSPINAGKRLVQVFTGNTPEAQELRKAGIFEDIAKALTEKRGKDAKQALAITRRAILGHDLTEKQAQLLARQVAATFSVGGQQATAQALR